MVMLYDCTLFMLEGEAPAEVQELYDLLCRLPVIVEYPQEWQARFIFKRPNSRGVAALPAQSVALLPDFSRGFQPDKEIAFPSDAYGLAAAIAYETLAAGVAARCAFAGSGNTAATEEVLLALYLTAASPPEWELALLPELAEVWSRVMRTVVPPHKPIIGQAIFAVESGIHVDGITKNPMLYEPFAPEVVGLPRKIIIGSHSGRASLQAKLEQLGLTFDEQVAAYLLAEIKQVSSRRKKPVSDEELLVMWGEYHAQKHPDS